MAATRVPRYGRRVTSIRDPIHGTLTLDDRERAIVDSPFFQRLRGVRQLGFAELAFPGATHSRYSHALGACHVATRLFDAIAAQQALPETERLRLRAAVRIAVLLHDLGHAPLSHASEAILPLRARLQLPAWAMAGPQGGQASHEDYTLKLVLDSSLAELLQRRYAPDGLTPEAIGSLIAGRAAPGGPFFTVRGVDWAPLLRQLVSSELDADRMDYLLRDSFFTGVSYGRIDLDWIASHLTAHLHDGVAELALGHRAIFAFEDFLLSRYHMFLSVYYHRTSICFDRMLRFFYREAPGVFEIPAEPEKFLHCDDLDLLHAVRRSDNVWAQRIAQRQAFKVVVEVNPYDTGYDLVGAVDKLQRAGLEHFATESLGLVSRYFGAESGAPSIWVHVPDQGKWIPLPSYTPLFSRYEAEVRISRIYVPRELLASARELLRPRA